MEHLNLPVTKIGCDNRIMETRRQLDEVMGVMRNNIEKMSERSDRLENLACRAEVLDMSSQEFHRCAVQVRRQETWRAVATRAAVYGVAALASLSAVAFFFI